MINSVYIKNYKSISECKVDLRPLTILVGPNGAGKSNFLDGLSFLSDCVRDGVYLALRVRQGLENVRRKSRGHPSDITVKVNIDLENNENADFGFTISGETHDLTVKEETCEVKKFFGTDHKYYYTVRGREFNTNVTGLKPQLGKDRLALPIISAVDEFRPVFNFLTNMRFYSINPGALAGLQEADAGNYLDKDGRNAAAVWRKIEKENPKGAQEIIEIIKKIVPGVTGVQYKAIENKETLSFRQTVQGDEHPWAFSAAQMSDGTLRVAGILLALYQINKPTFIGIEEPEATVHPAALEVLMDVINAKSREIQILITTHSPEILDYKNLKDENVRIVEAYKGATKITTLPIKAVQIAKEKLFTYGELLKAGELTQNDEITPSETTSLYDEKVS